MDLVQTCFRKVNINRHDKWVSGERIYGFMDLQGRIKSKPQFYTTSDSLFDTGQFTNGKLFVETKDGKKGYVNEEEFEISNTSISENIKKMKFN